MRILLFVGSLCLWDLNLHSRHRTKSAYLEWWRRRKVEGSLVRTIEHAERSTVLQKAF